MHTTIQAPQIHHVSRAIGAWSGCVVIGMALMHRASSDVKGGGFFTVGPHADMVVLGITIDTGGKYAALVLYSFFNSAIRAVHANVLSPWLVNSIQHVPLQISEAARRHAYEVTVVTTVYHWVDWLMYMSILLTQIDMFLIELLADVLMTCLTTWTYIRINTADDNERAPLVKDVAISSTL